MLFFHKRAPHWLATVAGYGETNEKWSAAIVASPIISLREVCWPSIYLELHVSLSTLGTFLSLVTIGDL